MWLGSALVDKDLQLMPFPATGRQTTTSENHPGWHRRKPGDQQDIGGAFYSEKRYATYSGAQADCTVNYTLFDLPKSTHYVGWVMPFPEVPPWPPFATSDDSSLDGWGTKAIAECKPTNSVADLATALIELKTEGLPKLIGMEARADSARKALGNEYLNVEFGWKPLVQDVRDVYASIIDGDAIMRQYIRDAGRVVRRRFDFPPVHNQESQIYKQSVSPYIGFSDGRIDPGPGLQGTVLRTRETSIRRWFSGAFMYHLPPEIRTDGMDMAASKAKHLWNVDLTPEVLWNVTPWSWAVDWFAPVGDLIGNLQDWADDGLVLKYGYIMEHSIVRDTYTWVGETGLAAGMAPPGVWTMTSEVKVRRPASPFGFGLTWNGFSPRQLAIAAALGLSKG